MSNSVISVISRFLEEYASSKPNKLKVIDAYRLYIMMTGALQFLYLCLRIQINPQNKGEILSISPERAFADFQFAHTVLHLVVINLIG
uniref:Dolichyl-diphosphooligosaccharide--protein glycosyltransferase subunit DAD1 n=1 Tax=Sinocyclocheilus rhinocerous TaxID=307959 RepID=A0A673K3A9_9TELE